MIEVKSYIQLAINLDTATLSAFATPVNQFCQPIEKQTFIHQSNHSVSYYCELNLSPGLRLPSCHLPGSRSTESKKDQFDMAESFVFSYIQSELKIIPKLLVFIYFYPTNFLHFHLIFFLTLIWKQPITWLVIFSKLINSLTFLFHNFLLLPT